MIMGLMGQYPASVGVDSAVEGGVAKLDSSVTEADDNPSTQQNSSANEMAFSSIDNDYSQMFVYNDNTIITVLELPFNQKKVVINSPY